MTKTGLPGHHTRQAHINGGSTLQPNSTHQAIDRKGLAEDPKALKVAEKLATRRAKRHPHLADEYLGAAYYGLLRASRAYDPSHGATFTTFCGYPIESALTDCWRSSRPRGFREPGSGTPPETAPLGEILDDADEAGDSLEFQDLVEGFARLTQTERHGDVFRLYHGTAGMTFSVIGRRLRISTSYAHFLYREAIQQIREAAR